MTLSIQQLSDDSKLSHALRCEVLEHLCPPELVSDLLSRCHAWGERERSLNQLLVVYYVIALSLFRRLNLAAVLRHLVRGVRWLWSTPCLWRPSAAALVYRRRQLGTPVLRHLFQRVCRPMATEQSKEAFRFGLRLMAIDGTLEEVADTPANALYFGRLSSGKHQSPFPQVRCVYLAEVGTHAIVDAVFAPCRVAEPRLAPFLLSRAVQPGMLVLMDRGIVSAAELSMLVQKPQAHALARLKAGQYAHAEQVLSDGSYLVTLHPLGLPAVQVRVIEYRLEPHTAERLAEFPASQTSNHSDPRQLHRLVTTLLDPQQAPAVELILCYHERWEIEACIDEQKTHLRLSGQPLRSKDPVLVRKATLWPPPGALPCALVDASIRLRGQLGPRSPQFHPCRRGLGHRLLCVCPGPARGAPSHAEAPAGRSARAGHPLASTPSALLPACRQARLLPFPSQATGPAGLYPQKADLL